MSWGGAGAKWGLESLKTGAKRFAIQKGMQLAGGAIGRQVDGDRGEYWGGMIGNFAGGLTNAGLAPCRSIPACCREAGGRNRQLVLRSLGEGGSAIANRVSERVGFASRRLAALGVKPTLHPVASPRSAWELAMWLLGFGILLSLIESKK